MIKFLGLGGKKEEKVGKGFIPTDRVKELSEKGFSEPEIIDVLRKEGFSADEIDRALTQALKIGVTGEPEAPTKLPTIEDLQASTPEEKPRDEMPTPQVPEVPERSLQYPEYYPGYGTEEMVEAIVRERMGEMEQTLSEFRAKYAELERKIANLHHQLSILSKSKSEFEQLLISKLDAQKDTLDDVNARLSSLEKAFKEALPALIESVRSLSDLVQRFKKE
ncbi:MAG TPA: hypothetical protein ENG34_00415 [Candidatus Aenigmarchaeota archaeon]|nr:hypothetical protein [Candidatus Aenigmarchaeota archaeon]